MNFYHCLWTAQSGSQFIEGSRIVRVLGDVSQAIAQAKAEVAYTLAMPKESIIVTVATQVEPATIR